MSWRLPLPIPSSVDEEREDEEFPREGRLEKGAMRMMPAKVVGSRACCIVAEIIFTREWSAFSSAAEDSITLAYDDDAFRGDLCDVEDPFYQRDAVDDQAPFRRAPRRVAEAAVVDGQDPWATLLLLVFEMEGSCLGEIARSGCRHQTEGGDLILREAELLRIAEIVAQEQRVDLVSVEGKALG
ncbi:hypothetical protein KC325_g157 [Hortaea werneckii]|nr:hypothetical protein KC325_g157 [Hortaea werneckii]